MSRSGTLMIAGGLGFLAKSLLSRLLSGTSIDRRAWLDHVEDAPPSYEKILLVDNRSNPRCDDLVATVHTETRDDDSGTYKYQYNRPSDMLNPLEDMHRGDLKYYRRHTNNNVQRARENIGNYINYIDRDVSNKVDMLDLIQKNQVISVLNLAGEFISKETKTREYYDDHITKPAMALLDAALHSDEVIRFVQPVIESAYHFYDNTGIALHPFVKSQKRMMLLMEALYQDFEVHFQKVGRKFDLIFVSIPIADLPSVNNGAIKWLSYSALASHPAYSHLLMFNGDTRRFTYSGFTHIANNAYTSIHTCASTLGALDGPLNKLDIETDDGVSDAIIKSMYLQKSDYTACAPADMIGLALYSLAFLHLKSESIYSKYLRESVSRYLDNMGSVGNSINIIESSGVGRGGVFKIPLSNTSWYREYDDSEYLSDLEPSFVRYYLSSERSCAIERIDLGIKAGIPRVTVPDVIRRMDGGRELELLYSRLYNSPSSDTNVRFMHKTNIGFVYPIRNCATLFAAGSSAKKSSLIDVFTYDSYGTDSSLSEIPNFGVQISQAIEDGQDD